MLPITGDSKLFLARCLGHIHTTIQVDSMQGTRLDVQRQPQAFGLRQSMFVHGRSQWSAVENIERRENNSDSKAAPHCPLENPVVWFFHGAVLSGRSPVKRAEGFPNTLTL